MGRAGLGLTLVLLVAVSCGGRDEGFEGAPVGSAIWPSVGPPWPSLSSPAAREALRRAEVSSQLVEAGSLEAGGILHAKPPRPPLEDLATVLVVRGGWGTVTSLGGGALDDLAEQLALIVVEWESARTSVRGLHLELSGAPDDLESAARAVSRLADELPSRLRLSLKLGPELLERPAEELGQLASAADFLVGSVYGQPWNRPDQPKLWDLDRAIERAEKLDALGRPYLAAIAIEGRILEGEGGRVVARGLGPHAMVDQPLSIEGAFVYEGFHRQLLDLTPRRELGVLSDGGTALRLEPGRTVRLARPTAQHLAELARALDRAELRSLEGFVWIGGGGEPNAVDVPVGRLAAIRSGSLEPGVELRVEAEPAAHEVRVVLRNGPDPTARVEREYNFVELDLDGAFFDELELGGFVRAELSRREGDGGLSPMERLRRADRLRLYFGGLEAGQQVVAEVGVRPTSAQWSAVGRANVLSPTGDVQTVSESEQAGGDDQVAGDD